MCKKEFMYNSESASHLTLKWQKLVLTRICKTMFVFYFWMDIDTKASLGK